MTEINIQKIMLRLLVALLVPLTLSACFSVKPTSDRGGKNLFETFYAGEAGTLYFIKPLAFHQVDGKEQVRIDFTFKYRKEIKDSATVNFSLFGERICKELDSMVITNTGNSANCSHVGLLFNEKKKKNFISRFTTGVGLLQIKNLFDQDDWKVTLYSEGKAISFVPDKRTRKAIRKLHDNLFIIM
ncbi:MAG: hypothetical protein GC180_00725 [Bacteroidetes bacterium]|nr:hypothetical protein [Bacteroidota bacterium]